ncbi:MAG: PAS domain S-box protein [Chloroflexi bacterium]|nr:PAS domain S-box protein [Chloroflexota bacterium]
MKILAAVDDNAQRDAWVSLAAGCSHDVQCHDPAVPLAAAAAGFPVVIIACRDAAATSALCREFLAHGGFGPAVLAVAADDEHSLALAEAGASHVLPADANAASRRVALLLALRTAALAERAREAEARVNDLVEDANDLIYTHDLAGTITSGNRAAQSITGYPPAELIGTNIAALVAPEHLPLAREMTRRKVAGAADQTAYELDIIRKDGVRAPLEVNTRIIFKDGRPFAVQGIGRDISERKRQEEALHASEQRFSVLFKQSPDQLGLIRTEDRTFVDVNDRLLEYSGYTREEVIGRTATELGMWPKPEDGDALIARLAATGKVGNWEGRISKKGGEEATVLLSLEVIQIAGEGFIFFTARDISERKHQEDAIARLAAIVDSAEDAIIARDLEGRVISWNRGAERLYGYRADEVLGRTLDFLEPPEVAGQLEGGLPRLLAGEPVQATETRRLTKDGRTLDISLNIFPVRNSAGELIAVAGTGRDITARKQAEARTARQLAEMRILFQLGQALDEADTLEDMLEAGVAAMVDSLGSPRASARMYDADGRLRFIIRRGLSDTFCSAMEAIPAWVAGRQPLEPWAHDSVLVASIPDRMREALEAERIRARLVVPLQVSGREAGLLTVFEDAPREWQAHEVEFAQAVASAVGLAIHRLQAETALRESEARTRLIIDTALDAVITIDTAGAITAWNTRAEAIFGWPAAEVMGRELAATIVRPGERDLHRAGLLRFLQTGEANILGQRREVIAMRRDGSEFPAELAVTPIGSGGRPTAFSAFIRDITARKRSEEALRLSEANYRAVVDGTSDAIFVMDRDEHGEFRCTLVNTAFEDLTRLSGPAIVGRTVREALPPKDAEWAESRYALAAAAGSTIEYEESFMLGRREVHLITTLTPVYGEDGACRRLIGSSRDVTARKAAEAALRASEANYRAIFDSISDGLYVMERGPDGQFRCTTINDAYCDLLDRTPGMVLDKTLEESLGPNAPGVQRHYDDAIAAGGPVQWEWSREDRDGRIRHAITQVTPLFDAEGACYRLIGSLREVTGLRQAEEAQERAEQHLRTVATNSPVILYATDCDGVITLSEGRGLEKLGFAGGALVGRNVRDVYPANAGLVEGILRAAAGETILATGDLGDATWETFMAPLRGPGGEIVGTIGVANDISDRRRAEALASRLGRLLDESASEVYVLEAGTLRFLQVNRGARENLGYTQAELDTMTAPQINPEFTAAGWARFVAPLLAGDRDTVHAETAIRRKDGSTYVADLSLSLSRSESPPVFLAVVQDITDRKRQEEALLQAQKLESLGVLAGGIAHDFNNLLVGILGNAGLALLELPPASPARDTIQQIETAGKHAADLARQMLAYSGKGRFVIQPVDLNSLVEEMTHLLRVSINKGVSLHYDLGASLPAVEGDLTQLRQVVMNLVVNASDAIGQESGVITIATEVVHATREDLAATYLSPDLPTGDYVSLVIRDTGAGMDAGTRAKIFDPFFTTKFTGRGLGLAAVLGIVRGHRGAIRIDSTPGAGSTFTLLLPRAAAAMEAGSSVQSPAAEWKPSGSILVVDDEDTVRRVTARALSSLGLAVLTAADGLEALATFREHQDEIRCTLLDMTMPGMDGEETFRALREVDPATPVVLMSGYTEQDATARFATDGLAGFIQKPYEISTLREVIRQVIETAS